MAAVPPFSLEVIDHPIRRTLSMGISQAQKSPPASEIQALSKPSATVPGHPDVVFQKAKVAVFIDGCFWHGCPKCYRAPKSHQDYWKMKVSRNRKRDEAVTELCKKADWRVLRIWEHEVVSSPKRAAARLSRILRTAEKAA